MMKCSECECDKEVFGSCEECGKYCCFEHLFDFGRVCEKCSIKNRKKL